LLGVYDPIPSIYSKDLSNIIGMMLQTNPNNRPTCDQLLSNETVVKRISLIKEGKEVVNEPQPIQLLKTIKLPRNMNEINQVLPKKKKYKEEMEEANLMNFDVNTNAKKNPVVDLIGNNGNMKNDVLNSNQNQIRNKEKEMELINQVNNLLLKDKNDNKPKEREILINNQNILNRNPGQPGPSQGINYHNYNHNYQGVLNNNVINMQRGVQMPNQINVNNNVVRTPMPNEKKDAYNNVINNRPGSAKPDPYVNNSNRPKTPILAKNENNPLINPTPNNVNYHIYNSQNQNNQQVKINNNIVPPNRYNNVIQPLNNRDAGVKVMQPQQKIAASPVQNLNSGIGSNRPQSAKVNMPPPQNDLKNKLNEVKQANDQLIRKNIGTPLDRPASPGKALNNPLLNNNKRQVVNSSPKNRSPPKNGPVPSRPSSGKEKTPIYNLNNVNNQINVNNQMLLRNQNEKKIVIEKVNYQRGQIQPNKIVDPRKGNYQYNPSRDQLNVPNKNNLINAMRNNNNPVQAKMVSPSPNLNLGPKIVYIKK
jgi:hypothetical protein